ncbi:1,4-dihydroxy-2-naphthoate polyprenyltransferase [Vibrio agarivorans]|uniref:1,4-dihydroxy-2-naphthoate octaprenyltransferase n=1 Tax=Vibrio agarivorans TaxID=153622 RepID=A0ABT7XWD6_9VIBR|nr:1,4-dihydroxy-2-naphthoate polyprenyltransferase [Vibrio agarivorans]MDN2480060.1 1,4-dihydroxy-2-naphthoate polyprenyltransferase [Vibrio agarivorans]
MTQTSSPATLSVWFSAARPKTLPLALTSIVTASALAYSEGAFSLPVALLALLTATLLQILSNLANDYGDAEKGTDNENRVGPMRAVQSGAVSLATMRKAIAINVLLTIASGLALVTYSLDSLHNVIVFCGLGILAIGAAIAYTMGSKPYGYVGLGDVSVFTFFGLLGVLGTYFLHTGTLSMMTILPAIGCGLLSVAVLNVNNMRDIENDAECGKRTVAVRLGLEGAKRYHYLLVISGIASLMVTNLVLATPVWLLTAWFIALVVTRGHLRVVQQAKQAHELAPQLPQMVKCALVSNLVFVLLTIFTLFVS